MKVTAILVLAASCVCGFPQPLLLLRLEGRIVGGRDVSVEDYPYHVSILFFDSHDCGGFIISQEWIVTAAHCFDFFPITSAYTVRAGSSIRNCGGVVHTLSAWINHPSYINAFSGYDIALLQLSSTLSLGTGIAVIPLISQGKDVPTGSLAVVTGWDLTSVLGLPSNQLQAVEVPIITNRECVDAYGPIGDSMICAGFVGVGGKDFCTGDSGGALVWNGTAVGVASWGIGCASPLFPGIYARVAFVRNWISKVSGI